MKAAQSDTRVGSEYDVRRYEPGDGDGFTDLYERIWEKPRDREWFRWKYVENPYLDHVPMFVAEADGEVVGARPFMAFRMRAGDETALAIQPTDTMVHPDHRRRGLFTRMTERALEFYRGREPVFVFNHPNSNSRPGYLEMGWRDVDEVTTHYRVQNPQRLIAARTDGQLGRFVGKVATSLTREYLDIRERRADGAPLAVERYHDVAADRLASLYRRRNPHELHALRDEAFYRWRFASPEWDRTTYVATDDGRPVAGVLARTRTQHEGITVTQLADVVPMTGGERWERALSRLLERIVTDHRDSDLVAAAGGVVPDDILRNYGFLSDGELPLSRVTTHVSHLVARPLSREDYWSLNGRPFTEPSSWRFTFAERDTS